jgi:fatty acid desaturase
MSNQRPTPPIDYRELKQLVTNEGLLAPQTGYYAFKAVTAFAGIAIAVWVTLFTNNIAVVLVGALLLAFASTQVALLGHDVGHRQGFRGRHTNLIARFVFGNLLLGISHTWWSNKHNQHHATPNHADLDPDIQFPMVVFSLEQLTSRSQKLRPLIALQAFIFPLLLPLQAANMRITSIQHLFSGRAKKPGLQAAVMVAHFALYGALLFAIGSWPLAIGYVAVHQLAFGLYNSSVFASNHKGMPVIEASARMDFLREQVLTSRNVSGHPLTDFWYGGLNYQIEHHLFPTMPRNKLREAQPIVEDFCRRLGISYHTTGLFASYRESWSHLYRLGIAVRRGRATVAGQATSGS